MVLTAKSICLGYHLLVLAIILICSRMAWASLIKKCRKNILKERHVEKQRYSRSQIENLRYTWIKILQTGTQSKVK